MHPCGTCNTGVVLPARTQWDHAERREQEGGKGTSQRGALSPSPVPPHSSREDGCCVTPPWAAGRDPASWTGREEDTWPWGREQGQERNTPSLLAADGGTEIASAPFPRERARSMDIDRKTLPWSERPSALAGG